MEKTGQCFSQIVILSLLSKTVSISTVSPPKTQKKFTSLLRSAHYISKPIPSSVTICHPLQTLFKKVCKICLQPIPWKPFQRNLKKIAFITEIGHCNPIPVLTFTLSVTLLDLEIELC